MGSSQPESFTSLPDACLANGAPTCTINAIKRHQHVICTEENPYPLPSWNKAPQWSITIISKYIKENI
jgi:hypothetical protein